MLPVVSNVTEINYSNNEPEVVKTKTIAIYICCNMRQWVGSLSQKMWG